jgi:hypothetical protein
MTSVKFSNDEPVPGDEHGNAFLGKADDARRVCMAKRRRAVGRTHWVS